MLIVKDIIAYTQIRAQLSLCSS